MTFKDFKTILISEMTGDKSLKNDGTDDHVILPVLNQALQYVGKEAQAAYLISNDIRESLLDVLCGNYILRKPALVKDDDSILDIDPDLEMAVVFHVAYSFGYIDNKKYYASRCRTIINEYQWLIYETVEGIEDECEQIQTIMEKHGQKKISTIYQTAQGEEHSFDDSFITAFDLYLGGIVNKDMTKSQYNNIILFIDYADGKIDSTHGDYAGLVELDKYLVTIGVE